MGWIIGIKCKKCGYEDAIVNDSGGDCSPGTERVTFFSKKTEYIVRMKIKDTEKYADKKFCAFDIKNKDKYEWTKNFKISDLKCPKCGKSDFEEIEFSQT